MTGASTDPHAPEAWRQIAGYEGLYEVSDLGRVRSLDRVVELEHPVGGHVRHRRSGFLLLTSLSPRSKHVAVSLCRDGSTRTHQVPRLVLEAFDTSAPFGARVVYADGNRANCSLANLSWRRFEAIGALPVQSTDPAAAAHVDHSRHLPIAHDSRECWRAIPGYEGFYEASDQGGIRSIPREVSLNHPLGGTRTHQRCSVALIPHADRKGRLYVSLSRDGAAQNFGVGRLVLAAFDRPVPDGCIVAHADDDKGNCALGNLSSRPRCGPRRTRT